MVTTDTPKRVKRITMHHADRPPFDGQSRILEGLQQRDLINIHRDDQSISVFPAAAAEDLTREEREVVYRLLGYEQPESDLPRIIRRHGLVGGRAAIAGTRIPVWQLVSAVRDGGSRREVAILKGVSEEDVREALAFAELHEEEIARDIFDNDRLFETAGAAAR